MVLNMPWPLITVKSRQLLLRLLGTNPREQIARLTSCLFAAAAAHVRVHEGNIVCWLTTGTDTGGSIPTASFLHVFTRGFNDSTSCVVVFLLSVGMIALGFTSLTKPGQWQKARRLWQFNAGQMTALTKRIQRLLKYLQTDYLST